MRFLTASALCWSVARSCGVLVHNEVLHRSTHLFSLPNSVPDLTQLTPLISPLLLSPVNAPSLQAGAFFPDWGYQCLSTDSEAEAAHWPPFLVASVEHVISKYGYLNESVQRSEEEQEHLEGLISFIFAIGAHQTQDATWHAIRLPTGFLAALAGVDFGGDLTKAHRVLDFGGDFMLATRLARMEETSKDWIRNEWKVPIKDIIAIYSRLGKDVNAFVLRYCTMRGLAALRSGLTIGPSLYDSMASQSPMFVNSLDDYYLGGLEEMTARTVSCWSNLTRWFAHGIDSDEKIRNGWGICDLFRTIKARGGAGETVDGPAGLVPGPKPLDIWGDGTMFRKSKKEFSRIQITTDKFGVETYTLPPMEKAHPLLPTTRPPSRRELLSSSKAPKFADPTYIATYTPYSHFGTSLSVGNFSSTPGLALAVGAPHETEDSSRPGEGNVYILPLSDILPSEPSPFSALQPEYISPLQLAKPLLSLETNAIGQTSIADQRFGISSTAWHTLNTTLLAVAAAGPLTYDASTPPSLPFRGTSSAGRIDIFKPGEPSRWLSLSIKGAELGSIGRRWWGEKMLSANLDGNGEWLVVAGGRGDGRRACEGREKVQMGEGEVGVFQLVSSTSSPGVVEVELGSEGGIKTTATAGITVNTYSIPLPSAEKMDVPCSETNTYESFGASLSFLSHSHTLLIGAPGAGGVGKVFGYRLIGGQFVNVLTIASPAASSTLRTGFGGGGIASGVTSAGQEWVVIGAGDEEVDGEIQAGVVRVYVLEGNGEVKLVGEVVTAATEDVEGRGGRKYGKFGRTIVADVVGGGVWVGSEYWAGETGGLWWVDVQAIISVSTESRISRGQKVLKDGGVGDWVKQLEVKLLMQGEEPNARFAASLAVGEDGDLVVGIPYSGVAREDQGVRFYGAIGVYGRK